MELVVSQTDATKGNATAQPVKFTQGPWFVFPSDHPTVTRENCMNVLYVGTEEYKPSIVRITEAGHANATDEDRANARLIAAAPELLQSCIDLLAIVRLQNGNLHEDINAIQATASAAIAKATKV